MTALEFKVSGEGRSSKGYFNRNWEAEEGMDDILTALGPFEMPAEEALRRARRLPKDLDNLELQNTLAGLHWDQGLWDEAAQIWEQAFKRCSALIPNGFSGQILWIELDNRPFLRVAYGLLNAHLHVGRVRAADKLAQQLLRWNPQDNLGVRWLLPDIAFLAGKLDTALSQYLDVANELPEAWYQAGRIALIRREYVEACTYIRRGVLANPYIAEGLTGRTRLDDHGHWHSSNMNASEWAADFLSRPSGRWADPERDFVDWVFNSSLVLRERAALLEIQEGLSGIFSHPARTELVDRLTSHEASFDPALSTKMVRVRTNRYGTEHWPWEKDAAAQRSAQSGTPS